jgi:hypothetical protein
MKLDSVCVVVVLPRNLLHFAQACADDADISGVVVSGLTLLAAELEARDRLSADRSGKH